MKLLHLRILGVLLLSSSLAWAQPAADTLLRTGDYTLTGITGHAEYQYRMNGGDTLRDGRFGFQGTNPRALLRGSSDYLGVSGEYAGDTATGDWRFEFGKYRLGESTEVVDYRYRIKVDGENRTATGTLAAGRPDGTWKLTTRRIESSEPVATTFSSEITFAAGTPQRSFTLEAPGASLVGRFTREGLAHDTWEVYVDFEVRENWHFQDGVLTGVDLIDGTDTLRVPIFEAGGNALSRASLDGSFIQLLRAQQLLKAGRADFLSGRAASMLSTNGDYYQQVDKVLQELGTPGFRPTFGVRVPEYTYAEGEVAQLDGVVAKLRTIDTLSNALLTNTAYRIGEASDGEVAYLRDVVEAIGEQWVPALRKVSEARTAGILKYLPRDRYYTALWPDGSMGGTLDLSGADADSTFAGNYPGGTSRSFNPANGSEAVSAFADYTLEALLAVRNSLNERINTEERQQVLATLEVPLLEDFALLDSIVQANAQQAPGGGALMAVRTYANSRLQAYSAETDVSRKQELARDLIACMENLDALALTLTELPERMSQIEALYTDEVWNNFTATVMEERLKKRLTDAYREQAVPHLLQRIDSELDCTTAVALNRQLEALHQRMRTLRGRDTDALESALRSVDNSARAYELIHQTIQ